MKEGERHINRSKERKQWEEEGEIKVKKNRQG